MRSGKVFLLVAFLVIAAAHEARPEDIIRIGIISTTFGYAPVLLPRKRVFKREGLVPEIVVISRNEQIVQALISDSLQFGNVPPNLLLTLRQQGMSEIKLIAGSFNGTTYSMITLPKYKKMEELKGSGARLAMSGITSAAAMMMKEVLKQRGVLYPRDYSLLSVGGSNVQFTALQTKQVDGALLAEPISLMAVEQGFSNLGDAYKLLPDFQLSAIGVREGWAQKNRGVVIRYLKALVSTYQWLHDNKEEAITLLTSITKLDKKYIPKSWETYTKTQIWPRTGEVNLKGVQTLARLMEEEGALKKPLPKPEDIIDSSYLEEARRALVH